MNVRWANSKCSLSNLSFVLPFSLCLEVVSKLQHRIFRLALGTFLNFLSRHFFVNTFLSHTMPMTKACNTNELHGPVLLFTIQHGTVQSSYAALALFFCCIGFLSEKDPCYFVDGTWRVLHAIENVYVCVWRIGFVSERVPLLYPSRTQTVMRIKRFVFKIKFLCT